MKAQKYKFQNVDVWIDCHTSEMPTVEKPHVPKGGKQWRKRSDRLKSFAQASCPGYLVPSVKICGGISRARGGKLLFLREYQKFNAITAVRIFKNDLLPALRRNFPRKRKFLIQIDGDGAFKSDLFDAFCKENGLERYPHPSRSPDIAPIENLWNEAERRLSDAAFESRFWRRGASRAKDNLARWAVLLKKHVRAAASKSFITDTLNRMPARIEKLIAAKGWRIKN